MSKADMTPTAPAKRPNLSHPRGSLVNVIPCTQRSQHPQDSRAVPNASILPMLSPRLRPVQTPAKQLQAGSTVASPSLGRPQAKIAEMIFCSSLQDRPEWAAAVPLLQATRAEPRWIKARLSSHDLAVRIARLDGDKNGTDATATASNMIRFVLVAPVDVGKPDTKKRLQRLAQQKSRLGGAVVFLLSSGDGDGLDMASYNQIQAEYVSSRKMDYLMPSPLLIKLIPKSLHDTDLAVLPLTAVATLPATIAAYCSHFTLPPQTDDYAKSAAASINLLRTYLGGPMPLSLNGAKRLIEAANEALHHPAAGKISLQNMISFCSDLRDGDPRRLAAILGAEDASRLARF